jgi:integrase
MASAINKLSAVFVARNNTRGTFSDGNGLYLQHSDWGTKSWVLRYRINSRKREMGLGSINIYSLAEARQQARIQQQLIHQGIDPIERRRAAKIAAKAEAAKRVTFAESAKGFFEDNRSGWRSASYAKRWQALLRDYAAPISALPVAEIETGHIVKLLREIWTTKPATAAKVRARIESVLDWATAHKFREGENPARWDGNLADILPDRKKLATVTHRAALPTAKVPAFFAQLMAAQGLGARVIELLALNAVRVSSLLKAEWREIDLAAAVWEIPGAHTKSGRPHRVPLAPRAVELLAALPSNREPAARVVSCGHTTLQRTLKRLVADGQTLHGFRANFKSWAGDHSSAARDRGRQSRGSGAPPPC